MSWRSNRSVEYAMTHRVGAGGTAERCLRPDGVRSVVERLQKWALPATQEGCQSCLTLPAMRLSAGMPLCSRCHAQKLQRLGSAYDLAGLTPTPATRAEDVEPSETRLEGYAIRFNEKSVELWGFYEYIRPRAADRMAAEKPDLRMLWNHDSSEPLGRTTASTLRAVKRSKGVWIENEPPRWAGKYVESIQRRDVTGQSFGFIALEDDWWLEDGIPHREILDMEIIEFSAVAFPAYPTTSIKAVPASTRSEIFRERQTAEQLRMMR